MKKYKYPDLSTALQQLVKPGGIQFPSLFVIEDGFERNTLLQELYTLLQKRKTMTLEEVVAAESSFSLFNESSYICSVAKDDPVHQLRALLAQGTKALFISDKKLDLEKEEELNGNYFEISAPKPWEKQKRLQSYLSFYFYKYGKKVERGALELLGESFSVSDQSAIGELEKLLLYVGQSAEITLKDVHAVSTLKTTGTIWNLWGAFADGNVREVFVKLNAVIDDDTHPLQVVRFFRTQFAGVLRYVEDPESHEFATKFKVEPLQKIASRYPKEDLFSIFASIDALEFQMKNSEGDPQLLLEIFLERILCLSCSQIS